MKNAAMLKIISVIFLLEFLNIVAHSAFRPLTTTPLIVDLASFFITMTLLFWAVRQVLIAYPGSKKLALLSGVLFLTFSSLLISPALVFLNLSGSEGVEFQDQVVAYVVSLPFALTVAWLAFVSDRKRRKGLQ